MKIFLSKRALHNYECILEYLNSEWNENVATAFTNKILSFLELVEKFPELGIIEIQDKRIYSFLISKHIRVFYRLKNNQIIILSFFDTRQNPIKKPK